MTKINKQKKREQLKSVFSFFFVILLTLAMGAYGYHSALAEANGELLADASLISIFVSTFLKIVVGIYIATILQVIIHEAGHLICGLAQGYRFISFRVGSFIWIREEGRLKMKRFSLAGMAGQCLLEPPKLPIDELPYVWYLLGGLIAEGGVSLLSFVLYLHFRDIAYVSTFLLIFTGIGIVLIFINGIPLKSLQNDAYFLLQLRRDKRSIYAFCKQMEMMEQMTRGVRIKDMPDKWFQTPIEEMQNSLMATLGASAYERLIDTLQFDEAECLAEQLLALDSLADMHRNAIAINRIYCELIGENQRDVVDMLRNEKYQKIAKIMSKYPAILRTEYAYALLFENDAKKARKIMKKFEKVAQTYPYAGEIEGERERIDIVNRRSNERNV